MVVRNRIGFAVVLWIACEIGAFAVVVHVIGLSGAILLGIVTSLVGGSLLKKVGTSALDRLRRQAGSGESVVMQGELALDGSLAAIGAALLLLPGFVTDAIGLVLSLAIPRGWIARRLSRGLVPNAKAPRQGQARPAQDRTGQARQGPATIDLAPEDWRPL